MRDDVEWRKGGEEAEERPKEYKGPYFADNMSEEEYLTTKMRALLIALGVSNAAFLTTLEIKQELNKFEPSYIELIYGASPHDKSN